MGWGTKLAKALGGKEDPPPKKKRAKPKKRKAKKKVVEEVVELSPKDQATANGESYFEIIGFQRNPEDLKQGAFEFEWNKFFVEECISQGYSGEKDHEVIDAWFTDVCRHVVFDTYNEEGAIEADAPYLNEENLGNGKKSYS